MLDLFNIAKPQGCDIQTFNANPSSTTSLDKFSWVKPRGVSHVYMMLIGAGGYGDGAGISGGSGAVTVWYGAAQHIPDILNIQVGQPSSNTTLTNSRVFYRGSSVSTLLEAAGGANGGSGGAGGSAFTANNFTASGFFQSVAGQVSNSSTPSSTTFLSGGDSGARTANYGYSIPSGGNGFFQMQPIIVGIGGSVAGRGAIGCGGGSTTNSPTSGGPGMVLIASW